MSLPAHAAPHEDDEDDELVDVSGLIGRVLADRYRVTGMLGVGGIGRVYRAEHLGLKREVALKVLLEHYQCVPELQRRFEREAMALAALRHPNIVSIIDFVSGKELTFLVMELVDGQDLDDILEDEGCLEPQDAFDIMAQVLSSLAYAHQRDVIHRDLKPQNVLVEQLAGGRKHAVILDFGLAKFMDGSGPSANLTKTGLIVGTPAYMAPEQASGAHADQRADVYAAGVMLYEMLSGEHPFDGEGQEMIRQHLLKKAPTLASKARGARVAPELEELLSRALSKDGADRFADGGAMLDAMLALPVNAYLPNPDTNGRAPTVRALSRAPTAIGAAPPVPTLEQEPTQAPRGGRGWALVLAAVLVGGAILGSTWMVLQRGADEVDPGAVTTVIAAEPVPSEIEVEAEPEVEVEAEPEPEPEPAQAETEVEAETEAEAVAEAPAANRPSPRNPWRRGVPRELARVRRRVARGQPVTTRHVRTLTAYRRAHPDEVRTTLVLAQVYMARGQAVRALGQYQRAYRRDMTTRGDPRMRRDLIRMASTSGLHDRASEALSEIYGTEVVNALNAAIGRARDVDDRGRLEDTLRRIQPSE